MPAVNSHEFLTTRLFVGKMSNSSDHLLLQEMLMPNEQFWRKLVDADTRAFYLPTQPMAQIHRKDYENWHLTIHPAT